MVALNAGPQPVRVITARALSFVLAAIALWDGAGLVFGGRAAVNTPSWAVLGTFPGPAAMGAIYLVTGALLLWSLQHPGELLAWVLSGGMSLYAVVSASFFASWGVVGGGIVWTAPSKTIGLSAMWLLALLARPLAIAPEANRPTRR